MTDAFDRLEQFFSGTLSLLYNTLISVALLLRDPIRGALRLTARYRIATSRQIGPSTLIFIIFLVVGLTEPFTIPSRPYALSEFVEAVNSQTVVAFFSKSLVTAFVGASLVDLFSRVLFASVIGTATQSVRKASFPRFQYAISFGLLCQFVAFAIPALLGFPRYLAIACCLALPVAGFWPSYRVVAKLCRAFAIWLIPVALMVLMSVAWVVAIEVEDALEMADVGLTVAESQCEEPSPTAAKCSMLIYNGSPDDIIVDLKNLSATIHADGQSITMQEPYLAFSSYPDRYIIAEKGKGFTLSFTGSSPVWTAWFAPHKRAYFTAEVTIPYRVANTVTSTWFKMHEWLVNIKQPGS
jgi:hypothetical protein